MDPTGWGLLPHEPTEGARQSNGWWTGYKYDNQYWEDYVHTNDQGKEVSGRQLKYERERRFYDTRQHAIDEYDTASHWQNTRLSKPHYEFRKNKLKGTEFEMPS